MARATTTRRAAGQVLDPGLARTVPPLPGDGESVSDTDGAPGPALTADRTELTPV